MATLKVKVEKNPNGSEVFISKIKSGCMERYFKQSDDQEPNFSYALITKDEVPFKGDNDYFVLNEVYVAERERGNGLAKWLINEVISHIGKISDEPIDIILECSHDWCGSDRRGLISLYESLGFKRLKHNFYIKTV